MPIAKNGERPAWIVERLRNGTMTETEAEAAMRLRGEAFGPEYGPLIAAAPLGDSVRPVSTGDSPYVPPARWSEEIGNTPRRVRAHARRGTRGVRAHARRIAVILKVWEGRHADGRPYVRMEGVRFDGTPWNFIGSGEGAHVTALLARARREEAEFVVE